jgi:hypothetical protein
MRVRFTNSVVVSILISFRARTRNALNLKSDAQIGLKQILTEKHGDFWGPASGRSRDPARMVLRAGSREHPESRTLKTTEFLAIRSDSHWYSTAFS